MSVGITVIDNLSINSDLSQLTLVEQLIDKVCSSLNIDEDMYGNVLIAVTEAVNNAIIHGNKYSDSLKVLVDVIDQDDTFAFRISDSGTGFDFTNLPDPTAPENIEKENGRGIFLIKNLADNLEFSENGKVATIFFNKTNA
jgi:serine/threonine-protein kinase RsbW